MLGSSISGYVVTKIHSIHYANTTTVIESHHEVHLLNRLQLYHSMSKGFICELPFSPLCYLPLFFTYFQCFLVCTFNFSFTRKNTKSFIINLTTFEPIVMAHPCCHVIFVATVPQATSYVKSMLGKKSKHVQGLTPGALTCNAIYSLKWSVTSPLFFLMIT